MDAHNGQDHHDGGDHLADTNPMRPVSVAAPPWKRSAALISLLASFGLTLATVVVFLLPSEAAVVEVPAPTEPLSQNPTTSPLPTEIPAVTGEQTSALPTLSADMSAALLSEPLRQVPVEAGFAVLRDQYQPFTFVPDRPRSEVIEYVVVSGDTMFSLAERFQVTPESIAWSNPRSIIGNLRPGMRLNIPPIDGTVERVANDITIADIAAKYNADPFAIIDWESNALLGAAPETVLTSGIQVFVPGGTGEQISWNPTVERSPGGSNGAGGTIAFAPGEPGSCGAQPNPGGFGNWTRPLNGYSWVQGFTAWHTGVDLSAPVGTPVGAALGGTVIFRGWNNFGYGYLVVLAHGPFTTVYGHLSDIYVSCGQSISPGQTVGAVGSTGNSSGPHLHFEIRYNDIVQDPTTVMPF
jgi:murein DD-endopeptidase MepM/ murein hydrolase activator NlpD